MFMNWFLTNPRKESTIQTSINYYCMPGKLEPAFVGLVDLQNPPHKWHGFRIFAHNPEVSGSNPGPVTKKAPFQVLFAFKSRIYFPLTCINRDLDLKYY